MQISAVREALADAARAVVLPDGLPKLTASGYVPDAVTAPHFFVAEYEQVFDRGMRRSLDELTFTTRVLVGRGDDRAAQQVLDLMLSGSGPASLKQTIELARGAPGEYALGGLAHDLHVMRVQGYRWYEHAGTTYVGAELMIKVIGQGDG
ncbi:hypothetical protein NFX46_01925 [Streptomyces phaeoluteigriseus]|uniref:Uncharacterized protein n=1 Tax=Streptomyces phaeoluteigriseus TaxID=114686 RepID=A0ABY4Z0Q2_9ACTN|nr:hypothetical protein [Streptomyces phaeoluteigriseus]USQ82633.1 hypothetical protein NFX46_01925 [Streptomyces phaeoluteigriseus]